MTRLPENPFKSPRFSLRTLLILLAVVPPLLWFGSILWTHFSSGPRSFKAVRTRSDGTIVAEPIVKTP